MKVKLKALKRLGRYAPGDMFEKGRTDANLLVLMKVAEEVPDAPAAMPRSRRTYRRRDMVAEATGEAAPDVTAVMTPEVNSADTEG